MTLFDTLFTALRGVTANKLRAALTTLGVIIGVASVIVMLALGNGARAAVEANFRFLGSNKVQISARQKLDDGELVPAGKILSYEDGLLMPAEVELVDWVEMWVQGIGKVRYGRAERRLMRC
jgi:ABC-type antimicrobial peptide transport system permease subunit